MTRHSKNCTASSVYSYNEKKKDAKASGYGSLKLRYGKDGVKDFDCCSLSLHPCHNPVITPDGHLFDKEVILEYIISKKNEINRKKKEYERQCKKEQTELEELGEAENRSRVERFLKTEAAVSSGSQASQPSQSSSAPSTSTASTSSGLSVSKMVAENAKKLPSFWIPSLTPHSKESKMSKPDKTIFCPISGKPLRAKDFINVVFTPVTNSEEKASLEGRKERYKCPVTGDILRNNVPCAVIRTTGHVVTMECVESLIKKDMLHPLNGSKLTDKDIIPLYRGGTGFANVNEQLISVKARPVLQA